MKPSSETETIRVRDGGVTEADSADDAVWSSGDGQEEEWAGEETRRSREGEILERPGASADGQLLRAQ